MRNLRQYCLLLFPYYTPQWDCFLTTCKSRASVFPYRAKVAHKHVPVNSLVNILHLQTHANFRRKLDLCSGCKMRNMAKKIRQVRFDHSMTRFCLSYKKGLSISRPDAEFLVQAIFIHSKRWFESYLNPHATSGDDTSAKLSLRHPFTSTVQWHLLILAFQGLLRLFVLLALCSSAFCH